MAKMIGKINHRRCSYDCCVYGEIPKRSVVQAEEKQWQGEAYEEMHDPDHANVLCHNMKTGMAGCNQCYPDDDWWANGFAEDLDDIEGVTTNMKRLE